MLFKFLLALACVISWATAYSGLKLMGFRLYSRKVPIWRQIAGHIIFVFGCVVTCLLGFQLIA